MPSGAEFRPKVLHSFVHPGVGSGIDYLSQRLYAEYDDRNRIAFERNQEEEEYEIS